MKPTNIPTYKIGLIQAQAYRTLQLQFRLALKPFELTIPEWSLLGLINDAGTLNLTQITTLLKSKASHPTVLVDQLTAQGLLKRETISSDRRSKAVSITEKGARLVPEVELQVRASLRTALSHIPREDLEIYFSVLRQLASIYSNDK